LQYLPGIVCGSIVFKADNAITVGQAKEEQNEQSILSSLEQARLAIDDIVIAKEIPKDKRHFPK
jgi:hypothetical protein